MSRKVSASLGIQWYSADIPCYYIDIGGLHMILVGEAITYGKLRNQRVITVYDQIDSKKETVRIWLGRSGGSVEVIWQSRADQMMVVDIPNESLPRLASELDAGWKESKLKDFTSYTETIARDSGTKPEQFDFERCQHHDSDSDDDNGSETSTSNSDTDSEAISVKNHKRSDNLRGHRHQ